jgi:hypothetical protein
VQGQPNVRYVLQSSTNFASWSPAMTNTLTGTIWNVSTNLSSPVKFWRAVWLPQ